MRITARNNKCANELSKRGMIIIQMAIQLPPKANEGIKNYENSNC